MRRTLLTAGVFALLAMIYVPTPRHGYRFIFSQEDTSIAFFQLLVNVVFAALLGAILATITPKIVRGARELPRWAWRWITGIAVIALLCIGGVALRNFTAAAADRAQFDEMFADSQLAYHHPDAAKFTLRNAARNWRFALRFDEATRVENRIKGLQQHTGQGFAWADEAPQAPGQPGARPSPAIGSDFVPDTPTQAPHDWKNDPVVIEAPSQAPQASSIPRARPVKKSMFDDLIPARTATPGR